MTLPDTVAITRDHPGSNALILRGVEADSDVRTTFDSGTHQSYLIVAYRYIFFSQLLVYSYVQRSPISQTK